MPTIRGVQLLQVHERRIAGQGVLNERIWQQLADFGHVLTIPTAHQQVKELELLLEIRAVDVVCVCQPVGQRDALGARRGKLREVDRLALDADAVRLDTRVETQHQQQLRGIADEKTVHPPLIGAHSLAVADAEHAQKIKEARVPPL
eukprot:6740959-Prymnesium_polylepis.3